MEEKQNVPKDEVKQDEQPQEWQTPELIVEDVESVTQGGPIGDLNPPDDLFYT